MYIWRFKCRSCFTVVTYEFKLVSAADRFRSGIENAHTHICFGCGEPDTMFEPEPPLVDFMRADGRYLCSACKKPYSKHPFDKEVVDWEHQPYLHVLCDGRRVKL